MKISKKNTDNNGLFKRSSTIPIPFRLNSVKTFRKGYIPSI